MYQMLAFLTYFGKEIRFSHEPVMGIKNLNIHGHIHNKEYSHTDNHKLFCIENTDYKPVLLQHLIK